MTQWHISLNSWIIQDGNYPDLRVGQRASFALEFFSKQLHVTSAVPKAVQHREESVYDITAEIVYAQDEVWVIDFGLQAFREEPLPPDVTVGACVTGQIWLGVDPFFYFESLYQRPAIPALIYTWHIDRITRDTAPFITTIDGQGRRVMTRDATKTGYIDIPQTDAWNDDDGHADYILICSRQDEAPRHRKPWR
jgi:hypothetical protein